MNSIPYLEYLSQILVKIPIIGRYFTPEFITYIFVGGFTTTIDFILYWFFVSVLGVWYLFVAAVVSPTTLVLNYTMHRRFTFVSQGQKRVELPKYIGLVIFNYIAALAILFFQVDILGFDPILSRVILYIVIIFWNFSALKLIVFR